MTENAIFFHGGCNDGWAAAWLVARHLDSVSENYELYPAKYEQAFPWDLIGDRTHVWVVDFAFPFAEMDLLLERGVLTWLDHHKTVADHYGTFKMAVPHRNSYVEIDMDRSGAGLTWDYLNRIGADDWAFEDRWLITHVENRDLWKDTGPKSAALFAYMTSIPQTVEAWDQMAEEIRYSGDGGGAIVAAGEAIVRYREQLIEIAVGNAFEIDLLGHKVLCSNCIYAIASDVAGKLAEGREFGAYYIDLPDGVRSWGLRSRDGGLDVAEIAQKFGGGGHRNASGFRTLRPDLYTWILATEGDLTIKAV